MNDEEPRVLFNENSLPLFVDTHIQISCMSVFAWEKFKQFSYFPIIVQPPNFPNLYISLCTQEGEELEDFVTKVFNNKNIIKEYLKIDNFDPLLYKSKDPTFLYLGEPDKDKNKLAFKLAKISQQILNPLGIGVFYSTQFSFATAVNESFKGSKYYQAPFSMEIVDRLLYKPELAQDKDLTIIDAISLMSLQYPLRPLIAPIDSKDFLRRRVIFSRITLNNPPPFFISKLYKPIDNGKIDPLTWVIVELEKNVTTPTFAVICNEDNKKSENNNKSLPLKDMNPAQIMNFNPWNEKANNVLVQFKNQKVAIISPFPGTLKVYSDESNISYKVIAYDLHF